MRSTDVSTKYVLGEAAPCAPADRVDAPRNVAPASPAVLRNVAPASPAVFRKRLRFGIIALPHPGRSIGARSSPVASSLFSGRLPHRLYPLRQKAVFILEFLWLERATS